jgi:hypothetical protein
MERRARLERRGTAQATGISYHTGNARLDGVTARATFRATRDRLDLIGLQLQLLGGKFRGRALVNRGPKFSAEGSLEGIAISKLAALGVKNPLPWDAIVSGPVKVSGPTLAAEARLQIEGALHGELAGALLPGGQLHLEPSYLELGGTRANIAGT